MAQFGFRFGFRSHTVSKQEVDRANYMFEDLHSISDIPEYGPSVLTRQEQIKSFLGKTGLKKALPEEAFVASNLAFHPSLAGLRKDEIEVITHRNLAQQEMHDLFSATSESDQAG